MEFRKDINGLRAVAVIAVVLYHFGLTGFNGGFSGVDVFFVLSGFLMASIILGKLEKNRFSLKEFYLSRARRIVPALTVLCATLLVLGWIWLPATDYAQLAKQSSSSLLFLSNFLFRSEAGYFDVLSQNKWLLHTWSLSVEWQFYLVFPLLLMGIKSLYKDKPFPLKQITLTLLAAAAVSLLFSVIVTPEKGPTAFFLLPARIWELIAGALAFIATQVYRPSERMSHFLFGIGLVFIVSGIYLFDTNTQWPGYAALVPVMGTVFIILANRQDSFLLSNALFQKIGLWSYSIYLWHWPVFVALYHFNIQEHTTAIISGIALSILLGFLSYVWVETPLRKGIKIPFSIPLHQTARIAAFLLVLVCGVLVYKQDGFAFRVPEQVRLVEAVIKDRQNYSVKPCPQNRNYKQAVSSYPDCSSDEKPAYVIWGDSHASAAASGIYEASGNKNGISLVASCPPLLKASTSLKNNCKGFVENSIETIESLPADVPVIVMFRFSYIIHGENERKSRSAPIFYEDIAAEVVEKDPETIFRKRLVETLCAIPQKVKRPVYVVKPTPELGIEVPKALARQLMFYGESQDISINRQDYVARHTLVNSALDEASSRCGIALLDPSPYLCDEDKCYGSRNSIPLYYDDDHLSLKGASALAPLFQQALKK